jgi:beta-lactamase regulating signal transducer with metallopeptidase domain
MNELQESHVVAHETAHLKRRDHWWKPLVFLLLAIYWFDPLCWLAYILLCRDIELACDEKVIRTMEKDAMTIPRRFSRAAFLSE